MRASLFVLAALAVQASAGCSQLGDQAGTTEARAQFAKCAAENKATRESQMLSARLWIGDGTDTVAKLLDPNPLTPLERDALVQVHNRAMQCRQIIIAHADQNAAWKSPFFQDYMQRSDEIFDKLASGALAVGVANKLSIESDRKLESDLPSGRGGVRPEEAKREQAIDAMLEESTQIAAQPQPRMTTSNCAWSGNALSCPRLR
jgi:hypothetical protein